MEGRNSKKNILKLSDPLNKNEKNKANLEKRLKETTTFRK